MGKISWSHVFLGGLVGGVFVFVIDILANATIGGHFSRKQTNSIS
jgi:hypothetical protein